MNTFVCQSVLYLHAHQCELDENGIIVAKTDFEFKELYSREKITFHEKSKFADDNILYEQSLTVLNKYSYVATLKDLTNSHLIVKIQKLDGSSTFWGSLEPYNPVQVKINTELGVAEISFFRENHLPEF
jgi:hypothetical protein